MSVSTIFGSPVLVAPKSTSPSPASFYPNGGAAGLAIECSSRPKKKATSHHMKTRPRKTQPWDIRRKPTVYPPLPQLPPDWTLVSSAADDAQAAPAPAPMSLEAPLASG